MVEIQKPSLRPSKAVEGGSAEFDGTIIAIFTAQNDYAGTVNPASTGAYVLLRNDEAAEGSKPRFGDFFGAGKSTFLLPAAKDGSVAVNVSDADNRAIGGGVGFVSARPDKPFVGLMKGSLLNRLLEKIVEAGFKETDMNVDGDENNLTYLIGQRFHFALGTLPTVGGEPSKKMLPTKYLGKDAGAPIAAGVVASTNGSGAFDAKAAATELVINALATAEGQTLTKAALTPLVSKQFNDGSQKAAIVKLLVSPAFLGNIEGVKFTDGKTLSL